MNPEDEIQRMTQQLPMTAMPMTGTGQPQGQQPAQDQPQVDPLDTYIIPARPSTLLKDGDPMESMSIRLARRRLSDPMGRRRL